MSTSINTDSGIFNFKCPNCSEDSLEQVITGVTVVSIIHEVTEDSVEEQEWASEILDDGDIDRFQCENCGYVIPLKHNDYLHLAEWAKNNCS